MMCFSLRVVDAMRCCMKKRPAFIGVIHRHLPDGGGWWLVVWTLASRACCGALGIGSLCILMAVLSGDTYLRKIRNERRD